MSIFGTRFVNCFAYAILVAAIWKLPGISGELSSAETSSSHPGHGHDWTRLGSKQLRPLSILNEVGQTSVAVLDSQSTAWRSIARNPAQSKIVRARAYLRCGEWLLGQKLDPRTALLEFKNVRKYASKGSPEYGQSLFDEAIALFKCGRYADAEHRFGEAIQDRSGAVNPLDCTFWARHAKMCADYHRRHLDLGIPQPKEVDPLGAAACFAACVHRFGILGTEEYFGKVIPHTGMGSRAKDIILGAERVGLSAFTVSISKRTLKVLPKPFMAHVEHDHYVAVKAVDDECVEYMCSDCGPWPGGTVRLTWKQWSALECDGVIIFARPDSIQAAAFAALPTQDGMVGNALLCFAPTGVMGSGSTETTKKVNALARTWAASGARAAKINVDYWTMLTLWGLRCVDPLGCEQIQLCVWASPALGSGMFASVAGDPVNLATGEEAFHPSSHLGVYNPIGPSVDWHVMYYSLSTPPMNGLGLNWSHPYNIVVTAQENFLPPGDDPSLHARFHLILPNAASIPFTFSTNVPPSSSNTSMRASVESGIPIIIDWCYASGGSNYFRITLANRTKWTTELRSAQDSQGNLHIKRIEDRVGNYINLNWSEKERFSSTYSYSAHYKCLDTITDSNDDELIWLTRDSEDNIACVHDRYGRAIYYDVDRNSVFSGTTPVLPPIADEVSKISKIVSYPTTTPAARFELTYGSHAAFNHDDYSVPFLNSITVPSATGTGTETAELHYTGLWGQLDTIEDSEGNTLKVTEVDDDKTKVEYKDSGGTVKGRYYVIFNSHFGPAEYRNASDTLISSLSYSSSNTPYKPSSITDGNSRTTSFTYDSFGQAATSTDKWGTTTTVTRSYSAFDLGEVTQIQQSNGTTSKGATTFTYYEPSGLLESVTPPDPEMVNGSSGSEISTTTTYTYTSLGNIETVESPGNSAIAHHKVKLEYGSSEGLGRPTTVKNYTGTSSYVATHLAYDSRCNVTSLTDELGNVTTADYDLADQPISVTLPTSETDPTPNVEYSYSYPGGPLTEVTAYNTSHSPVRQVEFTYGAEGELLERSGDTEPVTFTYDALYRAHTVTDGNNHSTTYSYNLNGQPIQIIYPGSDDIEFTEYDIVGNLLTRVDGNNSTTHYEYDNDGGALSAILYPDVDEAPNPQNVAIEYDAFGRPTSVQNSLATLSATYDDLGLALSQTTNYSGIAAKTIAYSYNPDLSRASMSLPEDYGITYGYDALGRMTSLTSPLSSNPAQWTYYDNGAVHRRTAPCGAYTDYAYDVKGNLTSLVSKNASNATLSSYGSFTYDAVFNLTSYAASVTGQTSHSGTTEYTYDSLDRLTFEGSEKLGGYEYEFAYDGASNPTTFRNVGSLTYNSNNQKSGTGYSYDGNGNPTTYAGTSLGFDLESRLTAIGSSWSAGYRPDGLRGSKTASSTTTYFLYDGATPVAELNSSGTITALNVFGADGLIGRVVPGGTDIQYLFDHQGNVAQRLDGSGSVVSKSTYDAYGAESSTSTPTDPFGYNAQSGYYLDRETGLYLCTYRYYDPAKGRWLNRDPIGYAGGMNLYGYCGGGPVGGVDASGLQRVTWLYRLYDEVGNFLKWGITRNPLTRHPKKFEMRLIAKYEDDLPLGRNVPQNRHALTDEHAMVEVDGGTLNRERWSSSRAAGCAVGLSVLTLDPIGFGENLGPFIQPYVDDAHDGLQETRINRWLGEEDEYTDFLSPNVPRNWRR